MNFQFTAGAPRSRCSLASLSIVAKERRADLDSRCRRGSRGRRRRALRTAATQSTYVAWFRVRRVHPGRPSFDRSRRPRGRSGVPVRYGRSIAKTSPKARTMVNSGAPGLPNCDAQWAALALLSPSRVRAPASTRARRDPRTGAVRRSGGRLDPSRARSVELESRSSWIATSSGVDAARPVAGPAAATRRDRSAVGDATPAPWPRSQPCRAREDRHCSVTMSASRSSSTTSACVSSRCQDTR